MSRSAQLLHLSAPNYPHSSSYAQCQSVVPARGEVAHFDLVIACRLPLTPQQETLLRTQTLLVDVADGEAQNEGPDQAEDDLAVAVDDVLGADVGHLDAAALDVVKRLVDILELLHPQLRARGIAAEGLVAEDFEEVDEANLGAVSTPRSKPGALLEAGRGRHARRRRGR
jgi:hypothetical protein